MRFLCALIFALLFLTGQAATTQAAETAGASKVLLLQKHVGKGLNCNGCHQENPPAKPVAMEKCLSCHGPYDKLADKTDGKGAHNPHSSHQGDLSCDSCHHVHKTSENYCSQCHQFEFDVP
ncbi:cytochrome c3 family protein [Xanthobacteraceae bacterium Astr-EGSB]|uniref:cytochrome c3 family protein n=1 Tax=Astrobacterium formosum TaxID=3069710 RepID=UPI0027B74A1B|nr:cytochrome c3 family protein [Xanthobacteraceae bacterium Astr-EGSB]